MAKRFTESDKWSDPWFRALRAEYKLLWLYLLDQCDQAGVINVDRPLCEFQIGMALDWEDFVTQCAGRVDVLEDGKWFVVRFIEFQYGNLSRDCRAHNPVFLSLERNGIDFDRCSKGYPRGIQRGQDKDKDKDKAFLRKKESVRENENWEIPEALDCDAVRDLLCEFEAMRKRIGKPIKSRASSSKILKHFSDAEHLIFALETCIGNEYQGLKADYRPGGKASNEKHSFAQQRVRNSQAAIDEFVNG